MKSGAKNNLPAVSIEKNHINADVRAKLRIEENEAESMLGLAY
jgi:hypothetical protein